MMQADRDERRAMIEALSLLIAASVTSRPSRHGEHVIGGSMPAGPEPLIDLRDSKLHARCAADSATSGSTVFEICEKVEDDLGVRYRLRRRTDGAVLPSSSPRPTSATADAVDAITPSTS